MRKEDGVAAFSRLGFKTFGVSYLLSVERKVSLTSSLALSSPREGAVAMVDVDPS